MTDDQPPRSRVPGIVGDGERAAATEALERALSIAIDSERAVPTTCAGRWVACAFAPVEPWPTDERGARLTALARAAVVRERVGALRLLFRKLGEIFEVVTSDFEVVAPAATRGDRGSGLMVRRRLEGEEELTVHADCGRSGRFNLTLDLRGRGRPVEARVSLLRGGRELVSEVARSGRAHLSNLARGSYRMVISERGAPLAELDLTFEDAAA